jgi:TonB family protein
MIFSICRYLVAGTLLFSFVGLHAEDTAAISERLHRAESVNSLDDATLKPWHLKLNVQFFGDDGKPTEQGTLEEWWAGPDKDKRVFISPTYTATEIRIKDSLYRSSGVGSVPEILDAVRQQVVHPTPEKSDETGAKLELRKQAFGKAEMDCIMLSLPMKSVGFPPLGLFPTYCLDRDKDSLRVNFSLGSPFIIRNGIGLFQGHFVSTALTAKSNNVIVMEAQIAKLETFSPSDADFVPTSGMEKIPAAVRVPSGLVAGRRLSSSPPPQYPVGARERRATGTVVMNALIGTDGHIHKLKLVSVPDPELAIAAVTAVRKWTYRPYILNGEPVAVETTITVNFAMGPG